MKQSRFKYLLTSVVILMAVINVNSHTSMHDELKDQREAFEEYRQSTRIEREKMQMDQFNEIKKIYIRPKEDKLY